MQQPLIPMDKIENLVQLEPALVILGLSIGAWLAYKLFLRGVSEERHRNLKSQFKNLLAHLSIGVLLFGAYSALQHIGEINPAVDRVTSYIGLMTLLSGAIVFVKVSKILMFEYLFLSHMKVAVPVLLVNIFTLLLSFALGAWLISEIFSIRLTPILATSAVFSLVLGLALQETLGNLFSGVALQFDKPYEIGDWIEVENGGQKWRGQVLEISWRATVLTGFSDELITISNRVMGQAQISNFSLKGKPIARSVIFRAALETPPNDVKQALLASVQDIPGVRKNPAPLVIITETTESWIAYKLVYFIENYGSQFVVADRVYGAALESLSKSGLELAASRLVIMKPSSTSSATG